MQAFAGSSTAGSGGILATYPAMRTGVVGPLDDAQIEAFRADGYVMISDAVSAEDLAALRSTVDRWTAEAVEQGAPWGETLDGRPRFDVQPGVDGAPATLRRVASPQEVCDVHLRVMRDSPLVDAAAQLIGPDVAVNNVKLNAKQPGAATQVKFHQDFAYEAHSNDDLVAVLLFVDDVTLDNGPLEVVPGTHRGTIHDHWQDGVFTGTITDEALAGIPAAVPCYGPAGAACLMHSRLVHGSAPNRTDRPRTLSIFSYRAEDSRILHPNHLPSIHEGEVVRGRATGRVRSIAYEMPIAEMPTTASFFDQQNRGVGVA